MKPTGNMMPPNAEWAVDARGLVKAFGQHRAVDGVDLKVRSGSIYGVLGPNGAGKTTTIRMLATLLRPDAGSASIFGYDVVKEPHPVRQLIGVTGQYASVDESLSARENLMLFSRLHGFGRDKARQRTAELLDQFGLTEAAKRPVKSPSSASSCDRQPPCRASPCSCCFRSPSFPTPTCRWKRCRSGSSGSCMSTRYRILYPPSGNWRMPERPGGKSSLPWRVPPSSRRYSRRLRFGPICAAPNDAITKALQRPNPAFRLRGCGMLDLR